MHHPHLPHRICAGQRTSNLRVKPLRLSATRHDGSLKTLISMKKRASIASLTAAALLWMPVHAHAACDGCVVNAVQSASSAVVNAIQRQAERERVARETELPIDACGASGSNYAASAVRHTQMAASRYRRGGASTSNRALNVALNQPAPAIDASRQTTATIHLAHYCSAIEAKLGYCTASTLPDGDTDAASLFTGAGKPEKPADLSVIPEQIDAARAYARLALDPNPPQHITSEQARTEKGRLYLAMQKAYQTSISSSEKAMFDEIASHTPFPGSAQLIREIKQSDAAARYFDATASRTAKRTGAMSLSELPDFEAGRRWRNPYWIVEMAAQADPVQLAREQLFTTAFIAELQYQRLQKSKHIEVLLGQILALLTRTMEQPKIEAQRLQLRSRDAP